MRAVIQKSFGGPEVLQVVEAERPKPLGGELLVKVHASAVNPVDVAVRSGAYPLLGEPPFGVGWDISGVVEEASPGARFEVGDEVYGMPLFPRAANAYAEYVLVPSHQVARKPASVDHVHAAAIPLAALTAWQGLVQAAGVKAGDRVLIHRAAGGVGHFAVQIAKARGAHVIALASAARHDFVRGLGADEVIGNRTTDVTEAVKDADIVFDSAPRATSCWIRYAPAAPSSPSWSTATRSSPRASRRPGGASRASPSSRTTQPLRRSPSWSTRVRSVRTWRRRSRWRRPARHTSWSARDTSRARLS